MTSNFLGGEGTIVERQLVDQPDEGTAMHAARGPRHRLEAPQEDAARLGGERRWGGVTGCVGTPST